MPKRENYRTNRSKELYPQPSAGTKQKWGQGRKKGTLNLRTLYAREAQAAACEELKHDPYIADILMFNYIMNEMLPGVKTVRERGACIELAAKLNQSIKNSLNPQRIVQEESKDTLVALLPQVDEATMAEIEEFEERMSGVEVIEVNTNTD